MFKINIILIILFSPVISLAFQDYDVSVIDHGKFDYYEITVDSCTTTFHVDKKNTKLLNDARIAEMVEIAVGRAQRGCH